MQGSALVFAALTAAACAGCAEASPLAPVVPAPRRSGAWQQFCEQAWNVGHASTLVSARGAEGWELVAMYNGVLCYKRPVPDLREYRPQAAPQSPQPQGPPGQPYVPAVRDPGF